MTDESKCTAASGCMGAVDCICPSHGPPQRSRRHISYLLPGMRVSHHYVHQPNPKEAKTFSAIHEDEMCKIQQEDGGTAIPFLLTTIPHYRILPVNLLQMILADTCEHVGEEHRTHMLNCPQLLVVTVPKRRLHSSIRPHQCCP